MLGQSRGSVSTLKALNSEECDSQVTFFSVENCFIPDKHYQSWILRGSAKQLHLYFKTIIDIKSLSKEQWHRGLWDFDKQPPYSVNPFLTENNLYYFIHQKLLSHITKKSLTSVVSGHKSLL